MLACPGGTVNYALLNTQETFAKLLALIDGARREVWLVSPYVTLGGSDSIGRAIRRALRRKVSVNLVLRLESGERVNASFMRDEIGELIGEGLNLWVAAFVHAKLYWSDVGALITSANLLATSLEGGVVEVGLWSSERAHIAEARRFYDAHIAPNLVNPDDMEALLSNEAALVHGTGEVVPMHEVEDPDSGFCIRCRGEVELNAQRPYCLDDYRVWARYRDDEYEDAFCHACGADYPASMRRPLCNGCFRRQSA